ncbi:MAG: hypothetical protein ABTA24_13445 [Arthrobacter sp.]
MFETSTSATMLSVKEDSRESGMNHTVLRQPPPAAARRTALGGSYVTAFGTPAAGALPIPAPHPAAGSGYTARFDGAGRPKPAAAVDSYTAAFAPDGTVAGIARGMGRYTDVNL